MGILRALWAMLGILWILRGHRGNLASAWLAVFKLNQQKLGVGVRTRGLEDRGRYAQPYGLSSFAEWVSNELSPDPFRMPQDLMEHMIFEKLSGSGTQVFGSCLFYMYVIAWGTC
ncbi:hypothetical protein VNO77_03539 [Canavalia gladiata]|uniref:Uncharacterized protein n=1 Tax=Canavalia gladiata TaxID=3824 RepID=A0AAN9R6X6_CANGL